MSIKVISLGSFCQVKHNIDIYFGSSETNLFDWIITDFRAVLSIFNDFEGKLFVKENFTRDNILMEKHPNLKIENKEIKFICIHDFNADHQNYELTIDRIIEKFLRRLERLKEYIINEENIHFVHILDHFHLTEYIPKIDDILLFFSLLRKINDKNNIKLHILIPPTKQNNDFSHLDNIPNLYVHNIKIINNKRDWTGPNFNWEEIFSTFQ